jgi:hypothetical protein
VRDREPLKPEQDFDVLVEAVLRLSDGILAQWPFERL